MASRCNVVRHSTTRVACRHDHLLQSAGYGPYKPLTIRIGAGLTAGDDSADQPANTHATYDATPEQRHYEASAMSSRANACSRARQATSSQSLPAT